MVSTRSHPRTFDGSPSKRSPTPSSENGALVSTPTRARRSASSKTWAHTPSNFSLIWLVLSTLLVIWDTGYVLGRPYTMPGGALHWPIFVPYELYGQVDQVYGFKAYNAGLGWTSAQGTLNALEVVGYLAYLWIVLKHGAQSRVEGRGAPSQAKVGILGAARTITGQQGAVATLIGFAVTMVTWTKTLLYFLSEYYSGFEHVGHNSWFRLIFLYILPSGPWLVIPAYLSYVYGAEILQGLYIAAGDAKKTQ